MDVSGSVDQTELSSQIQKEEALISQMRTKLHQLIMKESKRKTWIEELKSVKNKLSKIVIKDDLTNNLSSVKKQIVNIKAKIDDVIYAKQIASQYAKMNLARDDLIKEQRKFADLNTLHQIAVDVECYKLTSTLDSINAILDKVLTKFFVDPITVRLKLYKMTKTTQTIKQAVNIEINYRNNVFSSINDMSGGEASRISLAMILAISIHSNSSILMLDESMAMLDDDNDLMFTCLNCIREISGGNKYVLIIDHKIAEDHYDNIINFDTRE